MRRWILAATLLVALTPPAGADSWSLSAINSTSNAGWYPTLALDAAMQPHVAYWFPDLHYAFFDGTAWQDETLAYAAEPAAAPATVRPAGTQLIRFYETHMALTTDGTPWIAYSLHDFDHGYRGTLVVTHKQSGAWVNEIIDMDDSPFILTADNAGTLWLLYHSSTLGSRLAIRSGGAWTTEPAPTVGSDLQIDRLGALWMVSGGGPPAGVYIARRVGPGTWTSTAVDTGTFQNAQIRFDASNRPHVAWTRWQPDSHGYLRHAAWNGTGWDIESIPAASDKAYITSFTLDGAGNPFISYKDEYFQDTDVAHRSNGTWVVDSVDPFGNSGTYASLITDRLGRPWMAYQANSGLWLAKDLQPVGVGDPTAVVASVRVALQGANPARAGVVARLRIESPRAGAIRIETFDVSGRRLGGVREWNVTAGTTELPWTAPATPGLCLVRATPGDGRPASARVMVIR